VTGATPGIAPDPVARLLVMPQVPLAQEVSAQSHQPNQRDSIAPYMLPAQRGKDSHTIRSGMTQLHHIACLHRTPGASRARPISASASVQQEVLNVQPLCHFLIIFHNSIGLC
jgi:hypothetical protein